MGKHNRKPSRATSIAIKDTIEYLDYVRYQEHGYSSLVDARSRKNLYGIGQRILRDTKERIIERRGHTYVMRRLMKK